MIAKLNGKSFILGSGSISRRNILNCHQLPFQVMSADINEKSIGNRLNQDANDLVMLVASAKNRHIMHILQAQSSYLIKNSNTTGSLLLTADTVITHLGNILEKPNNADEARSFLRLYSNSYCSAVTALVLTNMETGSTVQVPK